MEDKNNCGCKNGHDHIEDHNHENCECKDNERHEHHENCNHEHKEDGSCCCGHDHDHEEIEIDTVELVLEDGEILECGVLKVFDYEEKSYIALVTLDDEQQVLLYELEEIDEDENNLELELIEDQEEFDKVVEVFKEIMDEEFTE